MSGSASLIYTPHVVSISASSRSGDYYIEVAKDLDAMHKKISHLMASLGGAQEFKPYNYYQMVWYEQCESEAAALMRMTEIKALPHSWQRALIQSENPQWLDLQAQEIGMPGPLGVVSEVAGTRIRSSRDL